MAAETLHLTELILCIQHEVQSAVDYIATQAGQPTELGESSAAMVIETLRVRLPFDATLTRTRAKVPAPAPLPDEAALGQALVRRKGLMLDIGKPGGMATFLKLGARPDGPTAPVTPTGAGDSARAEIEITFAPLQRPR